MNKIRNDKNPQTFKLYRSLPKLVLALAFSVSWVHGSWAEDLQAPTTRKLAVSAASKHEGYRPPSNLMIWAYVGPGTYLANAEVKVMDVKGKVVAVGRTGSRGTLFLTVPGSASETEPYLIVTSGGLVDGVPIADQLKAYVTKLGFGRITYLDPISTAAQKMSATSPRMYAANMVKVRRILGLGNYATADIIRLRNTVIGKSELRAKIKESGGVARFTDTLAKAAETGKPIRGLKPATSSRLGATGVAPALASESPTGSACSATFDASKPSESQPFLSWQTVADFGFLAGTDLLSAYTGGGVASAIAGFALSATNLGGSDATSINNSLNAIETELGCISSQLSMIENMINESTLNSKLSDLNSCKSGISTAFSNYSAIIANRDKKPLDKNNNDLAFLFENTEPSAWANCNFVINTTLFDVSPGVKSNAWYLYVKSFHDYSNVFFPADIYNMQTFLAYYSTLQYQQSVLRSDFFNYQKNIKGINLDTTSVDTMIGSKANGNECSSEFKPNASNFCQVQMNITKVWPQTIFSDEVALCNNNSCNDFNPLLKGIAIVAVPTSLGIFFPPFTPFTPSSSPFSVLPPSGMTCRDGLCFYPNISPNTLANSCIAVGDKSNCSYTMPTTLANNTLDNFNNYALTTTNTSNTETYWTRLAKREGVATSEQLVALSTKPDALNSVAPFLSSWLNYSNGAPDPKSPTWTLLHSSTTLSSNFKQDKQTTCFTQPDTHITQCQTGSRNTDSVSISNGLYNPGYNFTPCNYTTNTCDGLSFPSTPAAAYLLQRSWNAGYTSTPKQDAPPQQDAPIKPVQPSPPFLGPTPLGPVQ